MQSARPSKEKSVQQAARSAPLAAPQQVQPYSSIENVLQLQRVVGNQQVMRLLEVSSTPARVIQRDPSEFGLNDPEYMSDYVSDAVKWWKNENNKALPVKAYADYLITLSKGALTIPCRVELNNGISSLGLFSPSDWKIWLNVKEFSENPDTVTVGQLTADEAAEAADTLYHEMRHSQQYFTAAQAMAGEGKDSDEIMEELGINQFAADQAGTLPMHNRGRYVERVKLVNQWKEWMGKGFYTEYKYRVNRLAHETRQWSARFGKDGSKITAEMAPELDALITTWKTEYLAGFAEDYQKVDEIEEKREIDEQTLECIEGIGDDIQDVIDTWEADKTRDVNSMTELWVDKVEDDLRTSLSYADRNFLIEQDAYAVGNAAGKEFREKSGAGEKVAL